MADAFTSALRVVAEDPAHPHFQLTRPMRKLIPPSRRDVSVPLHEISGEEPNETTIAYEARVRLARSGKRPSRGASFARMNYSIGAIEARWENGIRGLCAPNSKRRYATAKMARAAVHDLIDIVAHVGLHMPRNTKRQRAREHEIIGKLCDAMSKVCGCRECRNALAGIC